jgi:quercetin dioxygenase-like cupin family protein
MHKLSLDAVAREQVKMATNQASGRSAETVYGGHERVLRQTLMALTAGSVMAEHESPGEATLLVVLGRVRLSSGDDSWEGRPGDLIAIPPRTARPGSAGRLSGAAHRSQVRLTMPQTNGRVERRWG